MKYLLVTSLHGLRPAILAGKCMAEMLVARKDFIWPKLVSSVLLVVISWIRHVIYDTEK